MLQAVVAATPGQPAPSLRGATFGVEGDGLDAPRRWPSRAPSARRLLLGAEQMAGYHAAAALASNYVVALVDAAAELLAGSGLDLAAARAALVPLAQGALAEVAARGLPAALTGPVRRGDAATVARHLEVLADGDLAGLYRTLARRAARIAATLPEGEAPAPAALAAIEQTLAR
ncbi:MAG: DUF2520 domain-containing protein [Kofleriaceae bacterium]